MKSAKRAPIFAWGYWIKFFMLVYKQKKILFKYIFAVKSRQINMLLVYEGFILFSPRYVFPNACHTGKVL